MMYNKNPAYKTEKNMKKKKAMTNPNKASGTGSCSSKGIRKYN